MDGVSILNEIEVIQVVNDGFNHTAGFISLGITVVICTITGFLIGRIDCNEVSGIIGGITCGLLFGILANAAVGSACSYPPVTETTMRYEVTVDNSVSLTEFYEHYNIVEQRGDIFVVEEKE